MLTPFVDMAAVSPNQLVFFILCFWSGCCLDAGEISQTYIDRNLTFIPYDIWENVTFLSLEQNKIPGFDSFPVLENLTKLFIRNNRLTSFPNLSNVTSLTTLDLQLNQISHVDPALLEMLTNLMSLVLCKNYLSVLPTVSMALNQALLYRNRLTTCPDFSTLSPQATQVAIWDNAIGHCPAYNFRSLPNVDKVRLASNRFTKIPDFYYIRQTVTEVDISDCELTQVSADDVNYLVVLQTLNLRANPLKHLPDVLSLTPTLTSLRLDNLATTLTCTDSQISWINAIRIHGFPINVDISGNNLNCFKTDAAKITYESGGDVSFGAFLGWHGNSEY